jgi:hypothetical protein
MISIRHKYSSLDKEFKMEKKDKADHGDTLTS